MSHPRLPGRRGGRAPRVTAGDGPSETGDYIYPGCEYTPDEIAFLRAMDQYKRDNRRPFPTWTEVLAVVRSCGWYSPAEAAFLRDRIDRLLQLIPSDRLR